MHAPAMPRHVRRNHGTGFMCFAPAATRSPTSRPARSPGARTAPRPSPRSSPGRTRPRPWGRYRQQYLYRCPNTACRHSVVEPYALAAATAIDWAQLGQRIGDRDKPLSAKTLARIQAGLLKYGTAPFATIHRGAPGDVRTTDVHRDVLPPWSPPATTTAWSCRSRAATASSALPTSAPMRTMTTRAETALVVPYYSNGHARPACEPLATVTTVDRAALVIPTGGTWNTDPYPASDPFRTRTTVESEGIAFIAELRGGGSTYRDVREPLATVTASGNHHMLVRHNGDGGAEPGWQCTPVSEPMRTLTTGGHQSLVGWDTTAPRSRTAPSGCWSPARSRRRWPSPRTTACWATAANASANSATPSPRQLRSSSSPPSCDPSTCPDLRRVGRDPPPAHPADLNNPTRHEPRKAPDDRRPGPDRRAARPRHLADRRQHPHHHQLRQGLGGQHPRGRRADADRGRAHRRR